MKLLCLMTAYYVELGSDGRVYIISGDVDTIQVRGPLPTVFNSILHVVVKVAVPPNETNQRHLVRIELHGPDALIQPAEQLLDPGTVKEGRWGRVSLTATISGVILPKEGDYTIRALVNGVEVGRTYLYVESIPV